MSAAADAIGAAEVLRAEADELRSEIDRLKRSVDRALVNAQLGAILTGALGRVLWETTDLGPDKPLTDRGRRWLDAALDILRATNGTGTLADETRS